MELKITFSNPNSNSNIPIDYQYFLSSWMYKVISEGDEKYAAFLHDTGYRASSPSGHGTTMEAPTTATSRVFKLFNFSNLHIPKFKIEKEILYIQSGTISLKARFKVDTALENFVKGLFTGQSLTIKNGFNRMAEFAITSVETSIIHAEEDTIQLKALSPIVVSKKRPDGSEEYLSPEHEEYEHLFFHNLLGKYTAAGGQLKSEWQDAVYSFKLNKNRKVQSKLISISKPNQAPIKVKGYLFEFELQAPSELIEIGLLAGFGKENAMGFGFGGIV
jgi:CRISPR-associated endoribonuclease Cas6